MVEAATFEGWIEDAILEVPERLRQRIENVVFVVEERVRERHGAERNLKVHGELLGLYTGVPLPQRPIYTWRLPDKITIFKDAIEQHGGPRLEGVRKLLTDVVHHEIAHFFGMTEREVRTWEQKRRVRSKPK